MDLQKEPIVGKPAPFFKSKIWFNNRIKDISLNDYQGKYTLIYYCGYKTRVEELNQLQGYYEEYNKYNINILATMTEAPSNVMRRQAQTLEEGGYGVSPFPILCDQDCKVAKLYNCYIHEPYQFVLQTTLSAYYIISPSGILR